MPIERLVITLTDDPAAPERTAITVELSAADCGTRMLFTEETPGFTTDEADQWES